MASWYSSLLLSLSADVHASDAGVAFQGSVFGNVPLYVGAQLAVVHKVDPTVVVYPSCPSNGWSSLSPLVPRPNEKKEADYVKDQRVRDRPVAACKHMPDGVCPHDDHYYGKFGACTEHCALYIVASSITVIPAIWLVCTRVLLGCTAPHPPA